MNSRFYGRMRNLENAAHSRLSQNCDHDLSDAWTLIFFVGVISGMIDWQTLVMSFLQVDEFSVVRNVANCLLFVLTNQQASKSQPNQIEHSDFILPGEELLTIAFCFSEPVAKYKLGFDEVIQFDVCLIVFAVVNTYAVVADVFAPSK